MKVSPALLILAALPKLRKGEDYHSGLFFMPGT